MLFRNQFCQNHFTPELFQGYCSTVGQWIRCRVNQKGGMGILERLNRTFKYNWLFRHDYHTLTDLRALADAFRNWYNFERRHSALDYQTPWSHLPQPGKPSSPALFGATSETSNLGRTDTPKTLVSISAVLDNLNHHPVVPL